MGGPGGVCHGIYTPTRPADVTAISEVGRDSAGKRGEKTNILKSIKMPVSQPQYDGGELAA